MTGGAAHGRVAGELGSGPGQQADPRDHRIALRPLQPGEGRANAVGIEQGPDAAHPLPRLGEAEVYPAGVPFVAGPGDESEPGQAGELQGHRRGGNPELSGEVADSARDDGIEVLQQAGEAGGQAPPGGRIAHLAAAAGGVDGRIGREDRLDVVIEHPAKLRKLF